MSKFMRAVLVLTSAVLVLFVVACGGGGSGLLEYYIPRPMPAGGTFTGMFYTTDMRMCNIDPDSQGEFAEVDMVQIGDHVTGEIREGLYDSARTLRARFEGTVQGDLLQFQVPVYGYPGHGYFVLVPDSEDRFTVGGALMGDNNTCKHTWNSRHVHRVPRSYLHDLAGRQVLQESERFARYNNSSGGEVASASGSESEARDTAAEEREGRREADREEQRRRDEAESEASHDRLMAGISQAIQNGGAQIQATIAENGVHSEQQRQIVRDQLQQQADRRAEQHQEETDRHAEQADQQRQSDLQQRINASHASTPLGAATPQDMTFCTTMTVRSIASGAVTACGQYGEIRVSLHNNCTERVTCELEFPGNEENNSSEVQAIPAGGTPASGPGDGTYQCYRRSAPSSSAVHATCHTTCTGGQEYRGMGICACPSRTDEINGLCYPACPSGSHRSGTNCVAD